jgi:hypothetical protein
VAALIELMATNVADDTESLLVMMAAVAVVGLLWRTCVFTVCLLLLAGSG